MRWGIWLTAPNREGAWVDLGQGPLEFASADEAMRFAAGIPTVKTGYSKAEARPLT